MNFTEFCIRRPVFTIVLSLIIIVLGVIGYLRVPVRGFPRIAVPVVTIQTQDDGASASVIETQITIPIENDVVGSPGLETMKSYSQTGRSVVVLRYKMGTNIDSAVNDVRNRLARIGRILPEGVESPVIEKRDPDHLQLAILSISDKRMNAMEITDVIQRQILPSIEQIDGVAHVDLFNDRDYTLRVLLNPSKMAAHQVTVNDMVSVLRQQNVNVPTGQIKSRDRFYSVLSQGELREPQAFQSLIIRSNNSYLLRFGDVADIKVASDNTESAMRVNGQRAVGLSIYATANSNPIQVERNIEKRVNALRSILPPSMQVHVVWNDTTYLKASLHEVVWDLFYAVILVVIVIGLFLGSIRSAWIPVVTIPICLVSACALIYVMGFSINVFTLLALVLAIGLVVDDAIVMLENIYRYLELGLTPFEASIKGSREIVFAIIAMTLTLAAVYAPIGMTHGLTGVVFREFAFTLALTVIVSGFVALTLSPMMCSRLLVKAKETKIDALFAKLMQGYQWLLRYALSCRWQVMTGLLVVLVVGALCYESMPSMLEPKEDTGAFVVRITPPSNASFSYIDRYAKQVESTLQKSSGVKRVMMMTGNRGGYAFVVLDPWSDRQHNAEEIMHEFMTSVSDIAGVTISAYNMSRLGGGGKNGDAVQFVIRSNRSFKQLYETVGQFRQTLLKNPGLRTND